MVFLLKYRVALEHLKNILLKFSLIIPDLCEFSQNTVGISLDSRAKNMQTNWFFITYVKGTVIGNGLYEYAKSKSISRPILTRI